MMKPEIYGIFFSIKSQEKMFFGDINLNKLHRFNRTNRIYFGVEMEINKVAKKPQESRLEIA